MANESNDQGETPSALDRPAAHIVPAPSESVWARIKDHKIAQWTLAYAAAAYALLDGTKIVSDAFDWPHQVLRIVTVLLILGLPLVVTLAWYHGHRALRRVSGAELTIITVLLVMAGGVLWHFSRSPQEFLAPSARADAAPATAFSPPLHSIAVLPFVNLSGDANQDYFSEGLTEELLNSLSQINELQVAAPTSSFSFKEHPDIATVAYKLNVGAVLEGSVRRSANTIRITVELMNAVTGFHLWSKTYDRNLGDVLKLQTEIATAVAGALKVTLLGDVAAKVELGGTRNPAAFDAYLRGLRLTRVATNEREGGPALAEYADAIRLDPNYALAHSARSLALLDFIYSGGPSRHADRMPRTPASMQNRPSH